MSPVRFAPGPFRHNGRVAAALLPSLLVAAGLGGRAVAGIFTVGTMLWYIMDAMQYREGAFSVVRGWVDDVDPWWRQVCVPRTRGDAMLHSARCPYFLASAPCAPLPLTHAADRAGARWRWRRRASAPTCCSASARARCS